MNFSRYLPGLRGGIVGHVSGASFKIYARQDEARSHRRSVQLSASPSSGDNMNSLKWMQEYLAAGGGKYADIIGFHMYNAVPEDDVEAARLFRALLSSYKMDKKPVWNTETG